MMTYEKMTDKNIIQECVRYILKDGLRNTDNGNWCTMASDIEKATGIPLLQIVSRESDIEYWLGRMEAVADVAAYQEYYWERGKVYENDWVFDVIYCFEYCLSIEFDYEWGLSFEEDYKDIVGTEYENFMKKLDDDEQFERMF